ncbi:MAG TPA: crosslink repair DNA glycosylase YcaQ family protein [Candidatus Limnocylindrales bacterium]
MPDHALKVTSADVLRHRARASGLDARRPPGSLAAAAWGGLQDSVPRGGVLSLHARVQAVAPDAWEDPSLVQIWFRGGTDYLVPRADAGIFTLGSYPRDPVRAQLLEHIADLVHGVTGGRMSRDIPDDLGGRRLLYRRAAVTGRLHIRWDASLTWVIPVERPAIDPEDARLELARRFFAWFAPASVAQLARWTGVEPKDARTTAQAIDHELVPVQVDGPIDKPGEQRFALAARVDALRTAAPIEGARLLPMDDPFTKLDHGLLVADEARRLQALPRVGRSPGYIPGAVLLDGAVVGGWQRQGRKVTIHPFGRLTARARDLIEREALALPIAGPGPAGVTFVV